MEKCYIETIEELLHLNEKIKIANKDIFDCLKNDNSSDIYTFKGSVRNKITWIEKNENPIALIIIAEEHWDIDYRKFCEFKRKKDGSINFEDDANYLLKHQCVSNIPIYYFEKNADKAYTFLGKYKVCMYNHDGVYLVHYDQITKNDAEGYFNYSKELENVDKYLSFEACKKAAELGLNKAQWELGFKYEFGEGTEIDEYEAYYWYKTSANNGYNHAYVYMGTMCYDSGRYEKAFNYFQQASKYGDLAGLYHLGISYQDGKGTEQNIGEAFKIYINLIKTKEPYFSCNSFIKIAKILLFLEYNELSFSCLLNAYKLSEYDYQEEEIINILTDNYYDVENTDTLLNIGILLYRYVHDSENAIQLFERAAELGNSEAQTILGILYYTGKNVEKDTDKAIELLKKSAALGNEDAKLLLGTMYFIGQDVRKNLKKAFCYLNSIEQRDNPFFLLCLGTMYLIGKGTEKNNDKGIELLEQTIENDYEYFSKIRPVVLYYLGCIYESTNKNENNISKSFELFQKSAELGYAPAQYKIALQFVYGNNNVKHDTQKAIYWFTKAATQGHTTSQFILGEYFNRSHKYLQASKWYDMASKNDNVEATFKLGLLHIKKELGNDSDLNLGIQLITTAASQGHVEAQYTLATYYETGKYFQKDDKKALEWYTKAAENKDDRAQFALYFFFNSGIETEKNEQKALELLEEAVKNGNVSAKNFLKYKNKEKN